MLTGQIESYFNSLKMAIDRMDRGEINQLAQLILEAYHGSATIFIFGNGGSAATASHFACDINKGVSYGLEKRFKVISLSDNLATITAYANDVGYDDVFVEQLKNYLQEGDLVIGISGSGNSANVLKAIQHANDKGNITVGITGYDGGKLKKIANHSVNANIDDMQISEDIHMILVHLMMKLTRGVIAGSDNYITC